MKFYDVGGAMLKACPHLSASNGRGRQRKGSSLGVAGEGKRTKAGFEADTTSISNGGGAWMRT